MKRNDQRPLVSVIMPVYNAGSFLLEAVESIRNQTYTNWELTVIDDCSSDNSLQILKSLAKKDKRIKVYALEKNRGPGFVSDFGIKRAQGKYIALMDADDIALSDRIEKQVKYLQENKDTVLLGGQCILIDEKGRNVGKKKFPTEHNEIYKMLFINNPIQHPSCMINRGLLLGRNRFLYTNSTLLAHDLELVFDLVRYGKLANLKDTVLLYRQRRDSLSLKNPKRTFQHTLKVRLAAIKNYGYRPTLFGMMMTLVQTVAVGILPNNLIYPLYVLMRGARGSDSSFIRSRLATT